LLLSRIQFLILIYICHDSIVHDANIINIFISQAIFLFFLFFSPAPAQRMQGPVVINLPGETEAAG
jgi:hypothetical protein